MAAAFFCAAVLTSFAALLAVPSANAAFRALSVSSPLAMGFVKFVFLATTGEILAARIGAGLWRVPENAAAKAVVWGVIGAALALLLKVYAGGVALLFNGGAPLLIAFATSLAMNTTFAPVMMTFHKMTDTWLALKAEGADTSLAAVIGAVDWYGFISFTVMKTIPFFWLPAHTVTFMLPPEYQTSMAAALSIVLGIILSLNKGADRLREEM